MSAILPVQGSFHGQHGSLKSCIAFNGLCLQSVRRHSFKVRDAASAKEKYGWKDKNPPPVGENNVELVEIGLIRRPLQGTRSNNGEKVEALMESIQEVGLQDPIDILLVDGKYYGFSGCHRFEACQRLGHEKILAKVRRGSQTTLRMHFM